MLPAESDPTFLAARVLLLPNHTGRLVLAAYDELISQGVGPRSEGYR